MKKILNFVELYVQWVALAVGVVYLLFMAWKYMIETPAVVAVGPEKLTPGMVDEYVQNTAVARFKRALEKENQPPVPKVENLTGRFSKVIAREGQTIPALAGAYVNSIPLTGAEIRESVIKGPGQNQMTALPKLAKATLRLHVSGRGMYKIPSGTGPKGPTLKGEDRDWVSLFFDVPMADIGSQFAAVNAPAASGTAFLYPELIREELVNGKWVNQKVIQPLAGKESRPVPGDLQPNQRKPNDVLLFEKWLKGYQREIVSPTFYTLERGDDWEKVRQDALQNAAAPPTPEVPATPDKAQPAPATPKPAPRPAPRRRVSMGDSEPASGRKACAADAAPAAPGPDAATGTDPAGTDPAQVQTPPKLPAHDPSKGAFDPRGTGETVLRVHDDTVVPTGTYRYKVRYKMLNPAFGRFTEVVNPQLATPLAIPCEADSDWTDPITIPPRVNFFVAGSILPNHSSVKVKVYKFEKGMWRSKQFSVTVGETVGQQDGAAGVDFTSGWALADIRQEIRGSELAVYMLFADEKTGALIRRDFEADKASPLAKDLEAQVANGAGQVAPKLP